MAHDPFKRLPVRQLNFASACAMMAAFIAAPPEPQSEVEVSEAPGLEKWQAAIAEFCRARDWDQFHGLKDLAIGVSTEASELLELFRFHDEAACEAMLKDPAKREKIEDELADVFFFLLRIAGKYGVDLGRALEAKMLKNANKYPVEKARGNNRKYDQL